MFAGHQPKVAITRLMMYTFYGRGIRLRHDIQLAERRDKVTLILRESDVRAVLTMPDTMNIVEAALRRLGRGEALNQPRVRVVVPKRGVLHTLPAYVPGQAGAPDAEGVGFIGLKTYTAFAGGVRFAVLLSSAEDGRLLAIIEADWLGQMRTGAASGVATRALARPGARIVGMIGAGGQAGTQLLAMCNARPVEIVYVYARDAERLRDFCARMGAETDLDVRPVAIAEEAIRPAEIVVTATTSRNPVMQGAWLQPGAHVNAMGSNWGDRREVDDETLARSQLIAIDSLEQARIEAGDLLIPAREGRFDWEQAVAQGRLIELGALLANAPTASGDGSARPGKLADDAITLFKSLGLGVEDVAVAAHVYTLARERGLGEELRLFDDA